MADRAAFLERVEAGDAKALEALVDLLRRSASATRASVVERAHGAERAALRVGQAAVDEARRIARAVALQLGTRAEDTKSGAGP